jgi:hypothetical protein
LVAIIESMRRIKAVSQELLSQRVIESAIISPDDSATKKDIMSLLVRARANEERVNASYNKIGSSFDDYRMSDREMMNQVVCSIPLLSAGP